MILVGGLNPLKNMTVNWDDEIPNIWENKKMFQTTNQDNIHECVNYVQWIFINQFDPTVWLRMASNLAVIDYPKKPIDPNWLKKYPDVSNSVINMLVNSPWTTMLTY